MALDPTSPIVVEQLEESLSLGVSPRDACKLAGVSWPRFLQAMALGIKAHENGLEDLPEAVLAIRCARAEAKRRAMSLGLILSSEDWRAHTWFLERSDPETYGKREHVVTSTGEPEDFASELRKRIASIVGGEDVDAP